MAASCRFLDVEFEYARVGACVGHTLHILIVCLFVGSSWAVLPFTGAPFCWRHMKSVGCQKGSMGIDFDILADSDDMATRQTNLMAGCAH